MKLTTLTYALFLGLIPFSASQVQAATGRDPMPPSIEKSVIDYFKSHLYLEKYDKLGSDFSTYFKGVELYELWKEDAPVEDEGISASSVGYVLVQDGKAKVYDDKNAMLTAVVKLYHGQLKKVEDVEKLFKSFGEVKKVTPVEGGFEVATKKFFDDLSGYRVSVKADGSISDCKYVMKFEKSN